METKRLKTNTHTHSSGSKKSNIVDDGGGGDVYRKDKVALLFPFASLNPSFFVRLHRAIEREFSYFHIEQFSIEL